MANSDPKCVTS